MGLPVYEQSHQLVEQFMRALATGDAGKLMSVLSSDAILYTDSGGKVTAPPRSLIGFERISSFLANLPAKVPSGLTYNVTIVNGLPGLVVYVNNQTTAVFSFHVENNRIAELYFVVNPDKLKLTKQPADEETRGGRASLEGDHQCVWGIRIFRSVPVRSEEPRSAEPDG